MNYKVFMNFRFLIYTCTISNSFDFEFLVENFGLHENQAGLKKEKNNNTLLIISLNYIFKFKFFRIKEKNLTVLV